MKQNFTAEQYVQLAKEQFCRTLKEVPFVEGIEVIPTGLRGEFGDFHAIAHFSDSEKPAHFYVDVKAKMKRMGNHSFHKTRSTSFHDAE